MTKTKAKNPPRIVTGEQDFFLITLAARAAGETQSRFIERMFRGPVKRFLKARGVDPDKAWSDYEARQ